MGIFAKKKKRIFLDFASTTPVDAEVISAMKPFLQGKFHNPSSVYAEGLAASEAIETARARVAKIMHCRPGEIIFTSGGTESNNWAIRGIVEEAKKEFTEKPHIITSSIEHPSVLETCKYLENQGIAVTYIDPDEDGRIHPEKVTEAIQPETVLVSIMHINNEIGTINPIRDVSREILKIKESREEKSIYPLFHCDAIQSPCWLTVNKEVLGADLISLDGSKIYGPKGSGILYKNRLAKIAPLLYGGGHEGKLRSGTLATQQIIGFAKALEICHKRHMKDAQRISDLRDYLIVKLREMGGEINGSRKHKHRVANNVNVCFRGQNSDFLVVKLDKEGVSCATMTACKSTDEEIKSHVIDKFNPECSASSLRLTLGRETKKSDLDRFLSILEKSL